MQAMRNKGEEAESLDYWLWSFKSSKRKKQQGRKNGCRENCEKRRTVSVLEFRENGKVIGY